MGDLSLEHFDNFCNDLKDITTTAATGAIIAYVNGIGHPKQETTTTYIVDLLTYFTKIHLNSLWHAYNKSSDVDDTVQRFNKILSYQIIKTPAGIVRAIDKLCRIVYGLDIVRHLMIDCLELQNDVKKVYSSIVIKEVLSTMMTYNKDAILSIDANNEDVEYDGSDFFGFEFTVNDDSY